MADKYNIELNVGMLIGGTTVALLGPWALLGLMLGWGFYALTVATRD